MGTCGCYPDCEDPIEVFKAGSARPQKGALKSAFTRSNKSQLIFSPDLPKKNFKKKQYPLIPAPKAPYCKAARKIFLTKQPQTPNPNPAKPSSQAPLLVLKGSSFTFSGLSSFRLHIHHTHLAVVRDHVHREALLKQAKSCRWKKPLSA